MKHLLIACALLATFGAHASQHLECTAPSGDIIELQLTYSFPNQIYINGDKMPLKSAMNIGDSSKAFVYALTDESEAYSFNQYKNGRMEIMDGYAVFYKCETLK